MWHWIASGVSELISLNVQDQQYNRSKWPVVRINCLGRILCCGNCKLVTQYTRASPCHTVNYEWHWLASGVSKFISLNVHDQHYNRSEWLVLRINCFGRILSCGSCKLVTKYTRASPCHTVNYVWHWLASGFQLLPACTFRIKQSNRRSAFPLML